MCLEKLDALLQSERPVCALDYGRLSLFQETDGFGEFVAFGGECGCKTLLGLDRPLCFVAILLFKLSELDSGALLQVAE